MAIILDSSSSVGSTTSGSILTWAHTINASNNALMLVHLATTGTTHFADLKFAGTSLTKVIAGTQSTGPDSECWYLLHPPAGLGTFNGTVTQSNIARAGNAVCYNNVNQTNPILGSATANAAAAAASTISLAMAGTRSWFSAGAGFISPGTSSNTPKQVNRGTVGFLTSVLTVDTLSMLPAAATGTLIWTHASAASSMTGVEINPLAHNEPLLDGTASGTMATTVGTVPHTIGTGLTNSMLVVGVTSQDSNHANLPIVSISFAGTNLTGIRQDTSNTGNVSSAIYYLLNPPAGAGSVIVTSTGAVWKGVTSSSWSNIAQTGQPDAQNGLGTANTSANPATLKGTTVSGTALAIGFSSSENPITALPPTSSYTSMGNVQGQSFENGQAMYQIIDAAAVAGTTGGTMGAGTAAYNISWASFAPGFTTPPPSTLSPNWLTLMGIGQT